MRRPALLGVLLLVAACASAADSTTTTAALDTTTTALPASTATGDAAFPVTVAGDNGEVTIESRPERIISLSTVATEMLFAIGAGDQVVAVDDQSSYPPEAPRTDLSGFTPNIEAIISYEPDLVVVAYDLGDVVSSLETVGVPVLLLGPAVDLDGAYAQIEILGAATGHVAEAAALVAEIGTEIQALAAEVADLAEGLTYFHEIDDMLYTFTSETFFGRIYAMFGLKSIADGADPDGYGWPQLSSEYVVAADPDLIFLADTVNGVTPESLESRPGWGGLTAVREGRVFEIDPDLASRWGPRVVDFARAIADAIRSVELEPAG